MGRACHNKLMGTRKSDSDRSFDQVTPKHITGFSQLGMRKAFCLYSTLSQWKKVTLTGILSSVLIILLLHENT